MARYPRVFGSPAAKAQSRAAFAAGGSTPTPTPTPGATIPAQSAMVARFSASSLSLANGATVTSWASTVGSDVWTIETGAPKFVASGTGEKPAVDFDGATRMQLPSTGPVGAALASGQFTALAVFQSVTPTQYGYAFSTGDYNTLAIVVRGTDNNDGQGMGGQDFMGLSMPFEDQTFFFSGFTQGSVGSAAEDYGNMRGICNGTTTLATARRTPGTRLRLGGNPDFGNAKMRLSELIYWNVRLTEADVVQFSKWAHAQHGLNPPWVAAGDFMVADGNSIFSNQNGTGGTKNALLHRWAKAKGRKLGTYTYLGFSGKSAPEMSATFAGRAGGIPALLGPGVTARYFGGEYANHGAGTATDAINRSKAVIAAVRGATYGDISWATSTDVANGETNYGADPTRRAAYNSYDWVGAGGADRVINTHLDATVGVEGACPAMPGPYGPNFSDTVHPADPGYVALATYVIANLP